MLYSIYQKLKHIKLIRVYYYLILKQYPPFENTKILDCFFFILQRII